MKINIKYLFAVLFASIAVIACNDKKTTVSKPVLVGKWVVVTDTNKKKPTDTSMQLIPQDSLSATIEFKDSSVISSQDTSKYYFDSGLQKIFIHDDATAMTFTIKRQTDSTIELVSDKDSVLYILQKKP